MNHKKKLTLLLAMGVLFGGYVSVANAQQTDWTPQYLGDPAAGLQATDTIRIVLPAEMPQETLQWLALELDSVDISELVQLEQSGDALVIAVTPVQPLASGVHELRLVEYNQAGDILERGLWTLNVAMDAEVQRQVARFFSSNLTLDGGYRVGEGDLAGEVKNDHGQGTWTLQGSSTSDTRESIAGLSLIYDSHGAQVGTMPADHPQAGDDPREGQDVELGEYLLSTRTNNVSAVLGHHAPVSNSLLIQEFHRRGASLTAQNDTGSVVASGFAYRTEPVSGFRYGIAGIGDHRHRVAGSVVSVSPLAERSKALTMTATYLEAEGQDHSGYGLTGNDISPEGEGWSVALESHVFDERLQLRAEHADTDYDFDGDRTDFEVEDDEASSYLGLFHIWQNRQLGDSYANWSVGYEQKKIGLFFRSLANPALPFDGRLKRLFTTLQVDGFSMQLQLAEENDNVRNDASLATLEQEHATLILAWSPQAKIDENGEYVRRWYGQPSFNFSTQYSDQLHVDVPEANLAQAQDRQTTRYSTGASFQYDTWYWQLNHSYGLDKDFSDSGLKSRQQSTDAAFQWQFGDKFSLGTQGQYESVLDRDSDNVNRRWLAGIDTRVAGFNNRLVTALSVSVNQDGSKDDSIHTETRTYGLRIDWLLREAKPNRPAWTLWLQGDKQDIEDRLAPANDQKPYQIFLGARMDWALNLPK